MIVFLYPLRMNVMYKPVAALMNAFGREHAVLKRWSWLVMTLYLHRDDSFEAG